MNLFPGTCLFETIPRDRRDPLRRGWWHNVQQTPFVSFPFARGTLLASDVLLLSILVIIGITIPNSGATKLNMELLFGSICGLLFIARLLRHILQVVGTYLAIVCLAAILNLHFPGMWGTPGIYTLSVTLCYRLPLRWSLYLAAICVVTIVLTNDVLPFLALPLPQSVNIGNAILTLVLTNILCWFGWNLRNQYLLVVRLQETREQLQTQMERNEEMATERERTRIARDIHDVLSHSIAVLSIQVQAARHLIRRDPEQLEAKLDEMAVLLRESAAESRQIVGLLRVQTPLSGEQDRLEIQLRTIAATFAKRTGIRCSFEERGTSQPLPPPERETLGLALREILTNAHRHGAAQMVWVTLQWNQTSLLLTARDDGQSMHTQAFPTHAGDISTEIGEHHGLQGMRERIEALGGVIEAGPTAQGSFGVQIRLPLRNNPPSPLERRSL